MTGLNYTCSMQELTNLRSSYLRTFKTGKDLLQELSVTSSDKAFIYNSIDNTKSFNTQMKRLGFKKVFMYKGNSGSRNVHTWIGKQSDIKKAK